MKNEIRTVAIVVAFIVLIAILERLQILREVRRRFSAHIWLRKECQCKHKVGKPVPMRWVVENLAYGNYYDFRKEFLQVLKKYAKKYAERYKVDFMQVMAVIDAIGKIEQGRVPMWGYNFFGIQSDLKWRRGDLIDYSFCIVDSGGYCRGFAGFSKIEKVAEFMADTISLRIAEFIKERGKFDAGWFYSCKWWRKDCLFNHTLFAEIYQDSLNNIRRMV